MKKVFLASMLVLASSCVPALAYEGIQMGAQSGGVQLAPAEYNAYQAATSQTDAAARASALESFLQQYPSSAVKEDVLTRLIGAYQQSNNIPKTLDAAQRLIAFNPSNLTGVGTYVYFKRMQASSSATPDQGGLDDSAQKAQQGLAVQKPASLSDADFQKIQMGVNPIFHGAIGFAAFNKKDYKTAITEFSAELKGLPADQTQTGNGLLDTYYLGTAYISEDPKDYINGIWFLSRAAALAPEPFHTQIQQAAQYWYKKYHGKPDGFDDVQAQAKASVFPPASLAITPAPSAGDIANQLVTATPDLTTLALGDREFIMVNGSQENSDKVWDTMKTQTKAVSGTVVSASPDTIQLAVSDDSLQSKVADYTIKLAEPLKEAPTVGSTQEFVATYDSYTKSPFMITMVNGKPTAQPKAAPKRPVHRTTK